MIGQTHYLNSGDWVESLTALVEHKDGRFEVIGYEAFCRRLDEKERLKALKKMAADASDLGPVEEDDLPASAGSSLQNQ